MATTITFTDTIGAATLQSIYPSPANRFANWTPKTLPVGDSVPVMANGAVVFFSTRADDYGASFELPGLVTRPTNYVAIANRLIAHLTKGGTCAVTTGDTLGSTYATCGLWPGSSPSLRLTDRRNLEWTLSLDLLNVAGSPVAMDCVY